MTAPFTNQPGAGLDANGNLLPGYRYMTYSNGVGQGTPMQIGALGAGGQTVTTAQSDIAITQGGGALMSVKAGANLSEVIKAINALGANPQDLISILQSMKAAGALRAELEVI